MSSIKTFTSWVLSRNRGHTKTDCIAFYQNLPRYAGCSFWSGLLALSVAVRSSLHVLSAAFRFLHRTGGAQTATPVWCPTLTSCPRLRRPGVVRRVHGDRLVRRLRPDDGGGATVRGRGAGGPDRLVAAHKLPGPGAQLRWQHDGRQQHGDDAGRHRGAAGHRRHRHRSVARRAPRWEHGTVRRNGDLCRYY